MFLKYTALSQPTVHRACCVVVNVKIVIGGELLI
jgi:hypothetical protein